MKKILLFITILLTCFIITGCGKDEEIPEWKTDLYGKQIYINEEALEAYNNAMINYTGDQLELIALLGEQVVAGTNYMYLCKDTNYKIVVVYRNLDGESIISNIKELDISKYLNKNISKDDESIIGGWYTEIVKDEEVLEENIKNIFDKAISSKSDEIYIPITLIAHQEYEGTNYAVLAYGAKLTQEPNTNVYLLTIKQNPNNNTELVSIACIDLGDLTY